MRSQYRALHYCASRGKNVVLLQTTRFELVYRYLCFCCISCDGQIHEVFCLAVLGVNVTICVSQNCQKYQICRLHMYVFFQAPNAPKPAFGRGPTFQRANLTVSNLCQTVPCCHGNEKILPFIMHTILAFVVGGVGLYCTATAPCIAYIWD